MKLRMRVLFRNGQSIEVDVTEPIEVKTINNDLTTLGHQPPRGWSDKIGHVRLDDVVAVTYHRPTSGSGED